MLAIISLSHPRESFARVLDFVRVTLRKESGPVFEIRIQEEEEEEEGRRPCSARPILPEVSMIAELLRDYEKK